MGKLFSIGNVIANGLDPDAIGFACGSISSIGADGYWIYLPANANEKIPFEKAVPLNEVLLKNPQTIIAIDEFDWRRSGLFIGGVIFINDIHAQKYVIRVGYGCCFMSHSQGLLVKANTGKNIHEEMENDLMNIHRKVAGNELGTN